MSGTTPQQLATFQRELRDDPALAERILTAFPPVQIEPELVIKCSPKTVERAVCRAVARCREWGEFWRVEATD